MPAVNTLPPPVAPGPVIQHEGAVMQLSGKGLLVPGSWKRRYCVLDGRRLYYYQLNEENQGHRHYRDKTSHYVDLDGYDICEEAKGIKNASNVLVISSSEIEKSFFDTGRLYLSAESAKEMNEWISQIRSAMTALRDGQNSQPAKNFKSQPSADVSMTCTTEQTKAKEAEPMPLEASISLVKSGEHLDCMTKQRAKGPTGRRLPSQAKSRLYPTDAVQQQQRSESLPRLELQAASSDPASNIRLSHIKHATIIAGNRLINRMMELDNVDESALVVDPAVCHPPTVDDDDGSKQTVPDHSRFDQSWFLGSARASVSTEVSPQLMAGGAEQCDDAIASKDSTLSCVQNQTAVAPKPTNRSWNCTFL